jgi:hypothetical protein
VGGIPKTWPNERPLLLFALDFLLLQAVARQSENLNAADKRD